MICEKEDSCFSAVICPREQTQRWSWRWRFTHGSHQSPQSVFAVILSGCLCQKSSVLYMILLLRGPSHHMNENRNQSATDNLSRNMREGPGVNMTQQISREALRREVTWLSMRKEVEQCHGQRAKHDWAALDAEPDERRSRKYVFIYFQSQAKKGSFSAESLMWGNQMTCQDFNTSGFTSWKTHATVVHSLQWLAPQLLAELTRSQKGLSVETHF